MKLKISQPEWILIIFAIFCYKFASTASITDKENRLITDNIITEKPIIIQTHEKNYNQPTLREYQECHQRRDKCLKTCETRDNVEFCKHECLMCPVLLNQDILVQGINDTAFQSPVHTTVNTTNVIRLTNEIRNIIDAETSNITSRNENNIFMHQNISMNGGKYGLGYNADGDCCLVVRSGKNCNLQRFSIGTRCHQKRHRVCGERCKARVMYAKRIIKCNDENENCEETIDYTTNHPKRTNSGCYTKRHWPFIVCGRREYNKLNFCQRCFQVSYGFILQYGLPSQCMQCLNFQFNNFGSPFIPTSNFDYFPYDYPSFEGPISNINMNDENIAVLDDSLMTGSDWVLNQKKCRNSDGTITDCINFKQDLTFKKNIGLERDTFDYSEIITDDNNGYVYDNDKKSGLNYDDFSLNKFNSIGRYRRSGYSKRHKK